MRVCPVCEDTQHSTVWRNVVACRCGMVYDHDPTPFDYSRVENYALAESDRARTQRTLEILIPYMGKTLLEIGCGQGELLERVGDFTTADGIDPSEANIEACNSRMLTVFHMGVEQLEPTREYDLIVMSHVLEHLTDVKFALANVRKCLPRDGHVYIEVPDATRHLDHLTIPMQEFSREHINHFSPMTLVRLLQRNGFWPVSMGTRSISQPGGFYPAMWVVATPSLCINFDDRDLILPALMKRYAEESERLLKAMALSVASQSNKPIIVWGGGVLADHLLPLLPYAPLQIIDRDRGKHGKIIRGCEVGPPSIIVTNAPILVCSIIGKESILRDMKNLGVNSRVITL